MLKWLFPYETEESCTRIIPEYNKVFHIVNYCLSLKFK